MPRKNTMRDNVNAVRSRLSHLSDLPREKIELALLYYESNVDETVKAFETNGANDALNGWTDMNNGRGHTSGKRMNNKTNRPLTLNTTSSSNGILRPSQRVSNIFQTFAEGGTPTMTTNGIVSMSNTTPTTTTTCSPSSIVSTPFTEQSDSDLQSNSCLNLVSTTTKNDDTIEQQKPTKSQRRKSIKNRNSSTSSNVQTHESSNNQQTTTFTNNKKLLTKSAKDLQRQTSTLSNVELLFNNEIKSSLKRIDDVFKQIYEAIKDREVQLYLEMDKVKEQGLNVIHRRQQRAVELRQRMDRCDRLEPLELDNLRHDIKQFVTDRRYDLGEELTSLHRFEYDQSLVEALKNFGTIFKIERKHSVATSSPLSDATLEKFLANISDEKPSPTNEFLPTNDQQPLPQRIQKNNRKQSNDEVFHNPTNGNDTGDNYSSSQTNEHLQYNDDDQNVNRRRSQQNFPRSRPLFYHQNGYNRRNMPKQINTRSNMYNNSETNNTYHRPQSIVPVQT
ncbi:unnamed protein product [Adineta steineri]|uniref:Uncharacterized protein n=1 Tax=Adineta steineri TaxID=433720 RepID=A0A820A0B9_9BILA|nr:unnamed protein product [Adineta steineri]CAF4185587.1 unnamed protein product [Adineta steineri]